MKYAVLLLTLMFGGCSGGSTTEKSPSSEKVSTEKTPSTDGGCEIKIDGSTIQVAKEDFPNGLNWDDAMAACHNLGNGWRLPNKEELKAMYEQLHTNGKGNFGTDGDYWSSSDNGGMLAWSFNFKKGRVDSTHYYNYGYDESGSNTGGSAYKDYPFYVRAVRTLP